MNAYNSNAIKNFCIITTNATFALEDFQAILHRFRKNFCFVVDEAHNFGAEKLSTLLPKKARYRIALSATIERHRDEKGTAALRKFFGKTCISFTLKEAITRGFLTEYYYHPIVTYLDVDELEKYNELTRLIIKNGGASQENCERNEYVELLLIKRARIIAGCRAKVFYRLTYLHSFRSQIIHIYSNTKRPYFPAHTYTFFMYRRRYIRHSGIILCLCGADSISDGYIEMWCE